MAFAPVVSAHTLSKDQAESSARNVAKKKVNDARTPYTYSEAVCDSQAVPHIRGCTLKYDTPATRSTSRWACVERIQIYYQPHNAGDPPPNYPGTGGRRIPPQATTSRIPASPVCPGYLDDVNETAAPARPFLRAHRPALRKPNPERRAEHLRRAAATHGRAGGPVAELGAG